MLTWILPGARGNFCGQQAKDQAVFVCAPNRAVTFQKTSPGAFLTAETAGPIEQAGRKPFESYRHLPQDALEAGNDTINQAAADECFANHRRKWPLRTVGEEIANRDGKIVVRIQKTRRGRDN